MPPSAGRIRVHTDGASRGNPGPAGAGWVLYDAAGALVGEGRRFLGRRTNNEAEYEAVIGALRAVQELGANDVVLCSDSELLVRQINGVYKVRNPRLQQLFATVSGLVRSFQHFAAKHVPREQNSEADAQANLAIDSAGRI